MKHETGLTEADFRILFESYKNRIFGYVLAITHDHYQAEEITQELFIKLWTSRHLLQKVENIDSYLFVMARHSILTYLRKASSDRKKLEGLMNAPQSGYTSAEEQVIDKEYHILLVDAVSRLSEKRREVYSLSRDKGMNMDEIAEHLSLSRNTVRNHLVEALKQIREQLAQHGIGMLLLFLVLQE